MQIRSFSSLMESYERLIARPNPANDHFYNGLYTRYRYPVLTREHIPPFWMYDADPASNPFMMQRLGVNATMNSGAMPAARPTRSSSAPNVGAICTMPVPSEVVT